MNSDDAGTLGPLVEVPEELCPECGSPIRTEDVYCPGCGHTLASNDHDAERERAVQSQRARPLQYVVLGTACLLVLGLGLLSLVAVLVLRAARAG